MHGVVPEFCSINVHSTIKTIHNINETGSSTGQIKLPHHHLQALLNFEIFDFRINILCFNMEGTNKITTGLISSYFAPLNPKPDIFILQNTQEIQTEIEEILSIDKLTHNTCCESTIIYNRNLFQLLTELEFVFQADSNDSQAAAGIVNSNGNQTDTDSQGSGDIVADNNDMITACIFKCLKIAGNPEIIVASFVNSTNNINNVKKYFELFWKNFQAYPILIAGGFNVELDTLKKNDSDVCSQLVNYS